MQLFRQYPLKKSVPAFFGTLHNALSDTNRSYCNYITFLATARNLVTAEKIKSYFRSIFFAQFVRINNQIFQFVFVVFFLTCKEKGFDKTHVKVLYFI